MLMRQLATSGVGRIPAVRKVLADPFATSVYGRGHSVTTGGYQAPRFNGSSAVANLSSISARRPKRRRRVDFPKVSNPTTQPACEQSRPTPFR